MVQVCGLESKVPTNARSILQATRLAVSESPTLRAHPYEHPPKWWEIIPGTFQTSSRMMTSSWQENLQLRNDRLLPNPHLIPYPHAHLRHVRDDDSVVPLAERNVVSGPHRLGAQLGEGKPGNPAVRMWDVQRPAKHDRDKGTALLLRLGWHCGDELPPLGF